MAGNHKKIISCRVVITLIVSILSFHVKSQTLVGSTDGRFSVSPSGGATYTIPIKLSSGYSEFIPQLSLVYNSQAGNDVCGFGWSISGLSEIAACDHNKYYDSNNISGVSATVADAYALDGMRLILLSGQNGKKGAEYTTEEESWAKITIDSAFTGTPKSFIVKRPDGTTCRYGSDLCSSQRYPNINSTAAIGWLLDYAEDLDGNYIKYIYSYPDNVPYLTEIKYGNKSVGISPENVIYLDYESRPDTVVIPFREILYKQTKRLKTISCRYHYNEYRKYTLNYDNTSKYSHLTSVIETGTDGRGFQATTFEWANLPSSSSLPSVSNVSVSDSYFSPSYRMFYTSGDVDNDGRSDLICVEPGTSSTTVYMYSKQGNTFVGGPTPYNAYGNYWHADEKSFHYWNMMGKLQGGAVAHLGAGQSNSIIVPILRRDIDGNYLVRFDLPMEGYGYQEFLQYTTDMPAYTIADFNKDGKDEVIYIEKKSVNDKIIRLVCVEFDHQHQTVSDNAQELQISSLTNDNIRSCLASDFDGDGLADILITMSYYSVILWNSNGTFSASNFSRLSDIKYSDTMLSCDLNEDGRVDLFINQANSTTWQKAINKGYKNSNIFSIRPIQELSSYSMKRYGDEDSTYFCIPTDLNSDGRPEFIINYKSGSTSKTVIASAGQGGTFSVTVSNTLTNFAASTKPSHVAYGDFDGDGRFELLNFGSNLITGIAESSRKWYYTKHDSVSPSSNRILAITDGLGKQTSITYKSLLDGYSNSVQASFPLLKFYAPISVVGQSDDTWHGTTYTTTYSYADGRFHIQGKGFLGFGYTSASSGGLRQTTETAVNTTYYAPYISLVKTTDMQGNLQNSHSYQYSFVDGRADKVYEKRLASESYGHFPEAGTTDISYSNFHYGQPQTVESGSEIQTTTTYTFRDVTTGGKWILCQPLTINNESVTTIESSGETDRFYTHTVNTYNPTTDRLTNSTEYAGKTSTGMGQTQYSANLYNTGGKVTRTQSRPLSSTENLYAYYTYNNQGLLTQKREPDGHITNYTYDQYGRLLTEADARFATTTTYAYDGMSRVTMAILKSNGDVFTPDTTTYTYAPSADANYAYTTTTHHSFEPTAIDYYDGFGRNSASGTIHFDGSEYITERTYQNASVVSFESLPHKRGTTGNIGTSYEYDNIFRPQTITDPEGHETTFAYYDNVKEVTQDGVTTYYEYNNDGRLVVRTDYTSSDFYGDVYYSYNAKGDISVADAYYMDGTCLSQTGQYDNLGRLQTETNANGNVRQYTYDQYGNVSSITRDGKAETFTYNKFGELTQKTNLTQGSTPSTTTYTYNSKHQLISVTGDNYSRSYTYNSAGQLSSSRNEVIDYNHNNYIYYITTNYSYSGPNRVSSLVNSTDDCSPALCETYEYTNGWRTKILFNGSLVWQLKGEDNLGRTSHTSNSRRYTYMSYNNNGQLTSNSSFREYNNNIGPYVFSHSYSYDNKGRLTSNDSRPMTYDDYNRLSSYKTQQYSYDDKGNIIVGGAQQSIDYDDYQLQSVTQPRTRYWGVSQQTIYNNGNNQPYILAQADTMAVFDYDSDWNRTIMTVYNNADVEDYVDENGNITSRPANALYDRVYIGNRYEVYLNRMLPPTHIYYIGGDPASAVAVATYSMGVMRSRNFIYRDHQGSITELVDTLGNVTSFYYDPWGRPCDSSGTPYANGYRPTASWFIRGYLSQEYYAKFRLINLNARLYNPHIGRFLSIDPVWNTSGDVFGFNPYIYGNNNPCRYVDPDGKFPWLIVAAALIGGGINLYANWDYADNFWKGLGFFAVGAGAGVAATMMPTAVGMLEGFMYGAAFGTVSGGVVGGCNALLRGEEFASGFGYGMISGFVSGGVFGAAYGGYNAYCHGRNWLTGKETSISGKSLIQLKDLDVISDDLKPNYTDNPYGIRWPDPDYVEGTKSVTTLQKGSIVDRYALTSSEGKFSALNSGTYFSEPKTPYLQRSIPYNPSNVEYGKWQLMKSMTVEKSITAPMPWYNIPGGGVQYRFINPNGGFYNAKELMNNHYIRVIK